jgi:PPOX class probable F420-dependent enzyme
LVDVDIGPALEFVRTHHQAVLSTRRRDGRSQLSPVTVGVDGEGLVVISTRETAAKTKNVRREPNVSICVMSDQFYGEWVQVDGVAEVQSLPEAMDGLVDYYRSISGEHPDWSDYRAAMERDRRCLLRIRVTGAGPDVSG